MVTSGLAPDCGGRRRGPSREVQSRGTRPGKPASGVWLGTSHLRPLPGGSPGSHFSFCPMMMSAPLGRRGRYGRAPPTPAPPERLDPPQPPIPSARAGDSGPMVVAGGPALFRAGLGTPSLILRGQPGVCKGAAAPFLPGPCGRRRTRSLPRRDVSAPALILAFKFPVGLELAAESQGRGPPAIPEDWRGFGGKEVRGQGPGLGG